MEIIYRSYDGKEFYTEAECLEHEEKGMSFEMYDDEQKTIDPDNAHVVVLLNERGAEDFVRLCERNDSPHEGITESTYFSVYDTHPLIFFWDTGLEEYREIEHSDWKILKELLTKHCD